MPKLTQQMCTETNISDKTLPTSYKTGLSFMSLVGEFKQVGFHYSPSGSNLHLING